MFLLVPPRVYVTASVSAVVQRSGHLCDYSMVDGIWENKFGFDYSQFNLSYRRCTSAVAPFFTSDDDFSPVL
jgi:hypothetical protein